jgi:hypothetical protein
VLLLATRASPANKQLLGDKILLERTKEAGLFSMRLEPSMTKLARSINPFETDSLSGSSGRLFEHCLPQCHDTLLDTRTTALYHNIVIRDVAISHETTKRGNTLLGCIELSRPVGFDFLAEAHTVDFVVDRSTMHVAVVTSTRDRPHDVSWMPGADTRDLAKALVRLAR